MFVSFFIGGCCIVGFGDIECGLFRFRDKRRWYISRFSFVVGFVDVFEVFFVYIIVV